MEREEFFSSILPEAQERITKIIQDDPCGCASRLDDTELRSIFYYTTEHDHFSYKRINTELQIGSIDKSNLRHQVYAIDSGLEKLNEHVGISYRGEDNVGRLSIIIENLKKEIVSLDEIQHLCADFYVSTTINRSSDLIDKKKVILTLISKGSARDIRHISAFQDEQEMLYKRNTLFTVLDVDVINSNVLLISMVEFIK